jgi:hypothetical protein
MSCWRRITIRRGINRIDERKCLIKGGEMIPITIKIYGTELSLFITENTEVGASLASKGFFTGGAIPDIVND